MGLSGGTLNRLGVVIDHQIGWKDQFRNITIHASVGFLEGIAADRDNQFQTVHVIFPPLHFIQELIGHVLGNPFRSRPFLPLRIKTYDLPLDYIWSGE